MFNVCGRVPISSNFIVYFHPLHFNNVDENLVVCKENMVPTFYGCIFNGIRDSGEVVMRKKGR